MKAKRTAEIEINVRIFNLSYRLEGFQAVSELKDFLDEHATDVTGPPRGHHMDPSNIDMAGLAEGLLAMPPLPDVNELLYGNQAPQYEIMSDETVEEVLNEKVTRVND